MYAVFHDSCLLCNANRFTGFMKGLIKSKVPGLPGSKSSEASSSRSVESRDDAPGINKSPSNTLEKNPNKSPSHTLEKNPSFGAGDDKEKGYFEIFLF
jgi:hypothetical protein